jgi:Raf kinase inhibitor-like YbhB/YbcL family protein
VTSVLAATSVLAVALAACSSDGRTLAPAGPDQTGSIINTTTTTIPISVPPSDGFVLLGEWDENGALDPSRTCDGVGTSPPLQWDGIPSGTQELALIAIDQTANGNIHWIMAGIPPGITSLAEEETPPNAVAIANAFGSLGWEAPCPPSGEPHTYVFNLYALGSPSELGGDATLQLAQDTILQRAFALASASAVLTR